MRFKCPGVRGVPAWAGAKHARLCFATSLLEGWLYRAESVLTRRWLRLLSGKCHIPVRIPLPTPHPIPAAIHPADAPGSKRSVSLPQHVLLSCDTCRETSPSSGHPRRPRHRREWMPCSTGRDGPLVSLAPSPLKPSPTRPLGGIHTTSICRPLCTRYLNRPRPWQRRSATQAGLHGVTDPGWRDEPAPGPALGRRSRRHSDRGPLHAAFSCCFLGCASNSPLVTAHGVP